MSNRDNAETAYAGALVVNVNASESDQCFVRRDVCLEPVWYGVDVVATDNDSLSTFIAQFELYQLENGQFFALKMWFSETQFDLGNPDPFWQFYPLLFNPTFIS